MSTEQWELNVRAMISAHLDEHAGSDAIAADIVMAAAADERLHMIGALLGVLGATFDWLSLLTNVPPIELWAQCLARLDENERHD